ncbi:MAG: hypothetical protein KDI82_00430 [Gammaproteobacteria bacterium]|nr:hypothetical protein [Gammaproteobacteria bacterium]
MSTRVFDLVTLLCAGVLASFVMSSLTPFGAATTPDSLSYLDIAAHIAAGDGWKTTDFSFDPSLAHGLTEQRAWPPLYPAALALFVADGADVGAAALLSGILLTASIVLLVLILRPAMPWSAALALGILSGLSLPMLTVHAFAWSETLFIALLLLAVWSGAHYLALGPKNRTWRTAMLTTTVAALILLVYTRYIGIVFSLLLPAMLLLDRHTPGSSRKIVVAGLVYALGVGYLLLSNLLASGHLSGAPRQPSVEGLAGAMADLGEALAALVPDGFQLYVLAVIGAALLAWLRLRQVPTPSQRAHARHAGMLLGLAVAAYLAALLALRSRYQFDAIDVRLVSPALVGLLGLLALLPWTIDGRGAGSAVQWMAGLLIVLAGAHGYIRLDTIGDNWQAHANPGLQLNSSTPYNNLTQPADRNSTRKFLDEVMQSDGVLVTDRPIVWQFRGGHRAMQRPAEFDSATLAALDRLPRGSLLVMPAGELEVFEATAGDRFQYMVLGETIAIPLPLGGARPTAAIAE